MKIRTKFLLIVCSQVVFFLLILLVMQSASRGMDEAMQRSLLTNRIVRGVSELNMITHDYARTPSQRAGQQWEVQHAALVNLLRGTRLPGREAETILTRIKVNLKDSALFFRQIIENNRKRERAPAAVRALLEEDNEHAVAQLMARSRLMIGDASTLVQVGFVEIKAAQAWTFWAIVTAILLAMAFVVAITWFLRRQIDRSLRTFAQGTERIAAGHLDHRLAVRGNDEIAGLSRAFNHMTAELAQSYAGLKQEMEAKERAREALRQAKDELETRVEERTAALSRSEQRISGILSSITDCYYALNRGWRVMEINDQALGFFGGKRSEFMGQTWQELFTRPAEPPLEEAYKKCLSEGEPCEFDTHFTALHRWAEVHVYPSAEGLSVYFKEITQRKQAEAALKERTAELETANRELEAFSYTVAHDLRAPLRSIDGFAQMLARHLGARLDEESTRKIRVIRNSVRHMGQLIDDLLAYSGLGRRSMRCMELDMEALVTEVWQEECAHHPDRQLELRRDRLPAAFGDPTMIRQVFVNLLGNAVKFTKHRETAVIEVGGRDTGPETLYYVKDNGIGFDMRYHEKLFEVFQRLDDSGEYEGTGVGLAIVQRSIHLHGGRIWAEGRIGEGAQFFFTLPRNRESAP